MQSYCSPDFYSTNHLAPTMNSSALVHSANSSGNSPSNAISTNSGCLTKFPNEIDPLNTSYATSYNNWSNGYNNYQYPSYNPPAPVSTQYSTAATVAPSHGAPTMLICPQVYSTVNQNQIHLHLHGTDKIEQYLNTSENGLTISSARSSSGIEIGIGTADNSNVIMDGSDEGEHQQQPQQTEMNQSNNRDEDQEVGDPSSVWRPY